MSHYSRRRLLGIAGVVGAASISGCLGRLTGGEDLDSFSHPPGFSADGIDPTQAIGRSSTMGELSSVELGHTWAISLPAFEAEVDEHGQFAFDDWRFRRSRQTFDALRLTLTIESEYFDSEELFRRGRVEPRSLEDRFTAMQYTMAPHSEVGIDDIQSLLESVNMQLTDVEGVDGATVGTYTATDESFDEGSLIREWVDSFGEAKDVSLTLDVTEDGYLTKAAFDGTFTNESDDEIELSAMWRYSNHDTVSVSTPEWVKELPGRERPAVEVDFEEHPPESIDVEIISMQHTDEVAVVIHNHGVVDSVTSPGVISVPSDAVTGSGDGVNELLVIAQNELRGPVQVDRFWPSAEHWTSSSS